MSRPRAISVMTRLPWPVDDGGRVALSQDLDALTRRWDVTLVVLDPPEARQQPVPAAAAARLAGVERVPFAFGPRSAALIAGVAGPWPYTLARFRSRALHERLAALVRSLQPELVFFHSLHVATHRDAAPGCAHILRQQNAETRWMERWAEGRRGAERWYAALQARRLRGVEARLCEAMDLVLAIQPEERDQLRALAPRAWVEEVSVASDVGPALVRQPTGEPLVLLAGSYAWPPNVEGALRFLHEGWPLLRERHPGVRLRLVGKQPPAELQRVAAAAGAELAGFVPSLADEFARASVLLVPLWTGGGVRVKTIEAMGAGIPIVGTPLAFEGIAAEAGEHALVGESPAALAEALARVLAEPALGERLGAAARARALRDHGREALAERMAELCAQAVARHARGRAA